MESDSRKELESLREWAMEEMKKPQGIIREAAGVSLNSYRAGIQVVREEILRRLGG